MKFYNINNKSLTYSASEAFRMGIAIDGGLFMPISLPTFDKEVIKNFSTLSIGEIATISTKNLLGKDIEQNEIEQICKEAFNFDVAIKKISGSLEILELFHGPTLAFKDFGARYLARLLAYFRKQDTKPLTVLVATSGDTGSAVANGFYKVSGINVIILYPSGKISPIQEKQICTLGENITALEVKGDFDDCQRLVKEAFADKTLKEEKKEITSANSINFGRLFPQSFYYLYAASRSDDNFNFSVPSGNLGNVTAGLIAKKMSAAKYKFIVACNSNDSFTRYLETGNFSPNKTIHTISNAMDVGNPNNFLRILELYNHDLNKLKADVQSFAISENDTKKTLLKYHQDFDTPLCPHTAVAVSASEKAQSNKTIALATAHPAKFIEVTEEILQKKIKTLDGLEKLAEKNKKSILIKAEYKQLQDIILNGEFNF